MSDELRERDQLEVGDRGLTLVSLLGTGRSSRTWLAVDGAAGLCVVRRIAGTSPPQQASLLRNLTSFQSLQHPSLLPPVQAWAEGGAIWVARSHDPGVSLRRLTAVARLTPAQVAAVGTDVLAGVSALHAAGLTHGNLHPGNILMSDQGRARITDIGLRAAPLEGWPTAMHDDGREADHRDDLEATAAALRAALVPAGRRGVSPAVPAHASELSQLLAAPGEAFGGAVTAEPAQAMLAAMVGEAGETIHRQLAALAAPLRGERLGASLRELVASAPPAPSVAPASPAAIPARGPLPPPTPPSQRKPPAGSLAAPLAGGRASRSKAEAAGIPSAPSRPLPRVTADPLRAGVATSPDLARGRAAVAAPLAAGVAAISSGWGRARGATAVAARRIGDAASLLRNSSAAAAGRLPTWRAFASEFSGRRLPRPAPGSRRALLWVLPVMAAVVITSLGVALDTSRTVPGPEPTAVRPSPTGLVTPSTPLPQPHQPSPPTPAVVAHPGAPAPPTAGGVAGLSVSLAGASACTATAGASCLLIVRVQLTPPPISEEVDLEFSWPSTAAAASHQCCPARRSPPAPAMSTCGRIRSSPFRATTRSCCMR